MKANQPMTSSVYMANRGGHCPVCSEPHVEGEAIESLDAETVTQAISCPACNAKWTDVYKMEKYESLLVDEKPVGIPQDSPSSDRQIDGCPIPYRLAYSAALGGFCMATGD